MLECPGDDTCTYWVGRVLTQWRTLPLGVNVCVRSRDLRFIDFLITWPTVNLLHTFVDNGALLLKSLLHSCLVFSVSAHGIALLLGLIANQSEIYDYIFFLENYTINQIWYFNDPILQWTLCFYIVRVGRQLKTNWDILKQSKTKIVKLRQGIRPLHFIGQIFSWIHHLLLNSLVPSLLSTFKIPRLSL